ncbi:hypothetical protein [Pleomorphovibrio marinus]|uniref:hypothetical protein n=1 Tax=Pleomorphovibrio marinus TaxID=2164132 RepID=UPI000E0CAC94|nr:hypothetical protein [Pleomorphovibrio marinus]
MKFNLLVSVFLLLSFVSQAQQVNLDAGLGLGTTFNYGEIGPAKILFTSSLKYQSNHRFDFSLDFLTTGQMGFSDPSPIVSLDHFDIYDERQANLTNFMFFSKYKFAIQDPNKYAFVGAGAGLSHVVQRVRTNETRNVTKNNFLVGIEAGLVRRNFTFGLRWLSPVTTPTFEEISEETSRTVVFSEANLTPILFYAKYDILRIWKL